MSAHEVDSMLGLSYTNVSTATPTYETPAIADVAA